MREDMLGQISDDPEEELSLESPEEIDERRKKRRYIVYAVVGFVLLMTVLIVAFITSESNEEEVVAASEAPDTNVPHPIVELAKLKSVPLQGYNVTTPLIANTPQELLNYIQVDGWIPGPSDSTIRGLSKQFSCLECTEEKVVDVWLRIYPNNQDGRKELYDVFSKAKEDNLSIVSEVAEMGSGGFIVNNNETISYWFYYEPNIVARVDMYQLKQGTLQETREWAFRLNYSIWSVVGR